jgi:sugar-specific transcriptional regulator TrmB
MITALEDFGLTTREEKVFLALVQFGMNDVSVIAKKAGVPRTSCYHLLARLVERGFVIEVEESKVNKFVAQKPEILLQLAEKRAEQSSRHVAAMQRALPMLQALASPHRQQPRLRYFEGKVGIETAYEETLRSSETIRAYASVNDIQGLMPHYFPRYYQRRREKGIAIRAIFPDTAEARILQQRDAEEARTSLLVPADTFDFSPEINIFDAKVIVISPPEEFAVIIESPEIAEAQKRIFELAWLGAQSLSTR